MGSLDELVALVPPPDREDLTRAWDLASELRGESFDRDYVAVADTYGAGSWRGVLDLFGPRELYMFEDPPAASNRAPDGKGPAAIEIGWDGHTGQAMVLLPGEGDTATVGFAPDSDDATVIDTGRSLSEWLVGWISDECALPVSHAGSRSQAKELARPNAPRFVATRSKSIEDKQTAQAAARVLLLAQLAPATGNVDQRLAQLRDAIERYKSPWGALAGWHELRAPERYQGSDRVRHRFIAYFAHHRGNFSWYDTGPRGDEHRLGSFVADAADEKVHAMLADIAEALGSRVERIETI